MLRGQIDLWFEESGELIVVDYKTDRDESHPQPIRDPVAAVCARAGTIRRASAGSCRALLFAFESVDRSGISEAELGGRENGGAAFREAQESLEFPLHAGEQCQRCQFFRESLPGGLPLSLQVGLCGPRSSVPAPSATATSRLPEWSAAHSPCKPATSFWSCRR